MLTPSHYHTYRRMKERPEYYRCIHPDCAHYSHRSLVDGKRALCPHCKETYIIQRNQIHRSAPALLHCENCTKGREKKQDIEKQVGEILGI